MNKNTTVGEIEKRFNVDLKESKDMTIGEYFIKKGYPSLTAMMK